MVNSGFGHQSLGEKREPVTTSVLSALHEGCRKFAKKYSQSLLIFTKEGPSLVTFRGVLAVHCPCLIA